MCLVERTHLVQLVMELRQCGPDELLPEGSLCLPVEVNVGDGIDGVVSEGAQVVGAGVGVGEVAERPGGGVQAGRVPVEAEIRSSITWRS